MIKILMLAICYSPTSSSKVIIDPCFSILHKFGHSSSKKSFVRLVKNEGLKKEKGFPLLVPVREEQKNKMEGSRVGFSEVRQVAEQAGGGILQGR